jgi:hypothetical protein
MSQGTIHTSQLGPRQWLGGDTYLYVVHLKSEYNGKITEYDAVNIREVDCKTGRFTTKGTFLSPSRWAALIQCASAVTASIGTPDHVQHSLGGGIMAGSGGEYACVTIRKFWMPDDGAKIAPTRKGIALKIPEWTNLLKCRPLVDSTSSDLKNAMSCADLHDSQREKAQCRECTPFNNN